jgi:DNA polymerase-3 subunit epsilon
MIRNVETVLQILPAVAIERLRALCDGAPIVFFDLEATGTDRQRDRIVEIGALRISGNGAIETYEKRLDPGVKIPREATAIHGITDDHVRGLPTFADVAAEVLAFFEGADLAGYNIRAFDVPLLLREFERAKLPFPLKGRRIVDAQTIFFKKEPRDLGAAVRFFSGRDHTRAHNALADVVAAAEVLAGQMERYADLPKALVALAEFSTPAEGRFVDPDKRFFWRDGEAVFNFGDMRGTPLAEVAQSNPGYLEWMLRRDFPEEAKQIARDALRGVFPSRDAKA